MHYRNRSVLLTNRLQATVVLMTVALLGVARAACAAEQDLQQRSLVSINHRFDERWSGSFQAELRIEDDISTIGELILKPAGYYRFTDQVELGFGYVVQDWRTDRGEELNEKFYASLRERYTIVIEEPAKDDKVAVLPESTR
jgi:hypothetical protein